jgi:hypothetical protein
MPYGELIREAFRVAAGHRLALTGVGAIGTFSHTFWTLAYLRLVAPPPPLQPPSERPY